MTTTANSFDHVLSELRIKPDDMPKMSSPSTPPTYSSVRDFQKALNHNAMTIHSYQTELGQFALVVSEETLLPTRTKSSSLGFFGYFKSKLTKFSLIGVDSHGVVVKGFLEVADG